MVIRIVQNQYTSYFLWSIFIVIYAWRMDHVVSQHDVTIRYGLLVLTAISGVLALLMQGFFQNVVLYLLGLKPVSQAFWNALWGLMVINLLVNLSYESVALQWMCTAIMLIILGLMLHQIEKKTLQQASFYVIVMGLLSSFNQLVMFLVNQ